MWVAYRVGGVLGAVAQNWTAHPLPFALLPLLAVPGQR